jgi:hypothetical protein
MNGRFRNVVLAALFAALISAGQSRRTSAVVTEPILEIFDSSRAIQHAGLAVDQAIVQRMEQSEIGKAYNLIKPERSILIYDCGKGSPWCSNSAYSFESVLAEAAKIANPQHPDPEGLASTWYTSLKDLLDGGIPIDLPWFGALTNAPFQLLAIANRMDLADFQNNQWIGAEIHFAYGLKPAADASRPQNLLVIMEFRLPGLKRTDFKDLALIWSKLSDAKDTEYAGKLLDALRASGFSLQGANLTKLLRVSSRVNHAIASNRWRLSQLALDPTLEDDSAHRTLALAPLEDQLSPNIPENSIAYLKLWHQMPKPSGVGVQHITIEPNLNAGPSITYSLDVLGPRPGVCGIDTNRDVLAIQQCTFCHTNETDTTFVQISKPTSG